MRRLVITVGILFCAQFPVLAQDGCDADVTQYLAQAAEQGAQAETETRTIESVPTAREVSCLESILSRDVGIWVSFPNFSDVAGNIARQGCRAVQQAVDDALGQVPSLNFNVPGVGNLGGGPGGTPTLPSGLLDPDGRVLDPSLLDALKQLRNQ